MKQRGKHTPEKWERGTSEDILEIYGNDLQGRRIRVATCNSRFLDLIPNKANADRIVACVNALEGISSEALESGVIGEMVEFVRSAYENESGKCDWITFAKDAEYILTKLKERGE